MIALQKEYARDLLTHRNPYTGNAYVDEPAVALDRDQQRERAARRVAEWRTRSRRGAVSRGTLAALAAMARREVQSNDELRAAWAKGAQQAGPEMLKNGDFAAKLEGWYLERHEGAEATAEVAPIEGAHPDPTHVNGAPRVRIAVTKPGKEPWHVQFVQGGLKVEARTLVHARVSRESRRAVQRPRERVAGARTVDGLRQQGDRADSRVEDIPLHVSREGKR